MIKLPKKCCGTCYWFNIDPDWEKCKDAKPGICSITIPFWAGEMLNWAISRNSWENKGTGCKCWKKKISR